MSQVPTVPTLATHKATYPKHTAELRSHVGVGVFRVEGSWLWFHDGEEMGVG